MVARVWRCKCPNKKKEGFIGYLNRTGIEDSSSTPGFKGVQILVREANETAEITLVTYWESLESIRGFAGNDIEMARLYPEDSQYEIQADRHVTHYEVFQQRFIDGDAL